MRICLDGRRTDLGGIGRITRELEKVLSRDSDHELLVLQSPGTTTQRREGTEALLFDAPHLSRVEYERLPSLLASRRVDVFISPQFYTTPALAMPLVSWVHDTWPVRNPEWLPPSRELLAGSNADAHWVARQIMTEFQALRRSGELFPGNALLARRELQGAPGLESMVLAMYAINLHRADRVVTVTEHGQRDLESLFPEIAERIRVISNPIPSFSSSIERETDAPPPQEQMLLHVSKWEARKNIPNLIQAFDRVAAERDVTLHLVGRVASPHEGREILAQIEKARFRERIHVDGAVTDDVLGALYRRASAFVMPSLFEGFSFPVVEAMAAGVPIVAANRGAIPEVVGDAAELFDPTEVADIARAIKRVLDDPRYRRELRVRGSSRVHALSQKDFPGSVRRILAEVGQAPRRPAS